MKSELGAVTEEALEGGEVGWCGDDQDFPDSCKHEGADGVVDHRLIVDRHELFTDCEGEGVEAGA